MADFTGCLVRNKTIIGLKYVIEFSSIIHLVRNKTIIGLKWKISSTHYKDEFEG